MQVNGIENILFRAGKPTINPSHQYSYDCTNDAVVHVRYFIDNLKASEKDYKLIFNTVNLINAFAHV